MAISEAIILMAHKLGLKVIAEGVETEAQLDRMRSFGINAIQGYLFSKPLPAPVLREVIKAPILPAVKPVQVPRIA